MTRSATSTACASDFAMPANISAGRSTSHRKPAARR